ncbi:hypothetical protein [Rhizobium leguminosarum]
MPKIYDINIDEHREVTQDDCDRMMRNEQAMGIFLRAQDGLRKAFLSTCSGQITLQQFLDMVAMLQYRS